jgi:hypothetical protein
MVLMKKIIFHVFLINLPPEIKILTSCLYKLHLLRMDEEELQAVPRIWELTHTEEKGQNYGINSVTELSLKTIEH